jgi:hypothetical protein
MLRMRQENLKLKGTIVELTAKLSLMGLENSDICSGLHSKVQKHQTAQNQLSKAGKVPMQQDLSSWESFQSLNRQRKQPELRSKKQSGKGRKYGMNNSRSMIEDVKRPLRKDLHIHQLAQSHY